MPWHVVRNLERNSAIGRVCGGGELGGNLEAFPAVHVQVSVTGAIGFLVVYSVPLSFL